MHVIHTIHVNTCQQTSIFLIIFLNLHTAVLQGIASTISSPCRCLQDGGHEECQHHLHLAHIISKKNKSTTVTTYKLLVTKK